MSADRFERAMHGIEDVFVTPAEIMNSIDLSVDERIELLGQWEQDLRQRMSASGDGMITPDPGRTAELLRQVLGALREFPTH